MYFGNYKWRTLHTKDDKILLITEDIIALRWYHHQFVDTTWEECQLRKYLNYDFYNLFSQSEKAKIITVTNRNSNNPWFKTKGGSDTIDRVFLLSLEEVCEYFGDSLSKLLYKDHQTWSIDDEHNAQRQAKYNHDFHWWRLRSPGYYGRTAASVSPGGQVYVRGNGIFGKPKDGGGIRPAIWLKLENQI